MCQPGQSGSRLFNPFNRTLWLTAFLYLLPSYIAIAGLPGLLKGQLWHVQRGQEDGHASFLPSRHGHADVAIRCLEHVRGSSSLE
jgi:hypothetical protein